MSILPSISVSFFYQCRTTFSSLADDFRRISYVKRRREKQHWIDWLLRTDICDIIFIFLFFFVISLSVIIIIIFNNNGNAVFFFSSPSCFFRVRAHVFHLMDWEYGSFLHVENWKKKKGKNLRNIRIDRKRSLYFGFSFAVRFLCIIIRLDLH